MVDVRGRMYSPALLALTFVVTGTATQVVPEVSDEHSLPPTIAQENHDSSYVIGEVIASEFDRHVPALSDNLRGELSLLRNDISRQFDSLRLHMDTKLDRMQRDAPEETYSVPERRLEERPTYRTPGATIRHNLAMAELRRLGADLTKAMNEEVNKLREEFRSSLDELRLQVQNSSENLASRLQDEFVTHSEESTTMLKKVFYLTRNQMALIQNQLGNITAVLLGEWQQPSREPVIEQTESVVLQETTTIPPPTTLETTTTTTTTTTTIQAREEALCLAFQ